MSAEDEMRRAESDCLIAACASSRQKVAWQCDLLRRPAEHRRHDCGLGSNSDRPSSSRAGQRPPVRFRRSTSFLTRSSTPFAPIVLSIEVGGSRNKHTAERAELAERKQQAH